MEEFRALQAGLQTFKLYAQVQAQPAELGRLLQEQNDEFAQAQQFVKSSRRVFAIGLGSSFNAALVCAYALHSINVDASAMSAFDFVSYTPVLGDDVCCILFTHTGRKQFPRLALHLLRDRNIRTVVVAASTGGELKPDDFPPRCVLLNTVAREPCPMFSVSHTAAMLVACRIAGVPALDAVPAAMAAALTLEAAVLKLALQWQWRGSLVALGAGPHESSAHELAVKVCSRSRSPSRRCSCPAAERWGGRWQRRRGAASARTRWSSSCTGCSRRSLRTRCARLSRLWFSSDGAAAQAFVVFAGEGPALQRTVEAAEFVLALGCPVAWVAPVAGPPGTVHVPLPALPDVLVPLAAAVVSQLLAASMALLDDVDPDSFRRDDPVFAEALARLTM
jgi:glucosamine 6-phosphate synthetase-like amidotransferase/phosphosugar isomerase protein